MEGHLPATGAGALELHDQVLSPGVSGRDISELSRVILIKHNPVEGGRVVANDCRRGLVGESDGQYGVTRLHSRHRYYPVKDGHKRGNW